MRGEFCRKNIMTRHLFLPLLLLRVFFALAVLFVLALLEYGLPIYVPLWGYALIIALTCAVLWEMSVSNSKMEKIAVPALFILGLWFLFSDSSDSSQAFMRQLHHRVEPGMSIAQVEAAMSDYHRYNRLFDIQNTRRLPSGELVLTEPDFAFYKHSTPDDGFYNAAHGVVYFKNGQVTGLGYVGD